ncbi:J domain-containing protein [Aggregicoccus sp. 17bor-14]|uniref:J domain-containing protein n=1 Tax=Myxococcaceae TaxID=31 RepID=UPI00351A6DA4
MAAPVKAPAPLAPAGALPPVKASAGAGLDLSPEQLIDLEMRCNALDSLDYFEVLKLEKDAAPVDIKRAFYRESRTYHPDRFFQLPDGGLKERVNELYKRVTEAYYFLRDDTKRRKYVTDVTGPERAQKLRFTETSEAETKLAAKKEQEEQIGTHPKGRQFYQTGAADLEAGRWASAERNLKMALTYEPQNARYKERLAEAQGKLLEESRSKGEGFKIR